MCCMTILWTLGHFHVRSMITIVGMPMPSPTAKAIMSPVLRPEPEVELVPGVLLLLLPVLLVPFCWVFVPVDEEPPAEDVELPLPLPLPPPLLPVDPVATAASADTTAVVALLACGLLAAG